MDETINKRINARRLSIISFSLLSSWKLSYPFQGQILHSLMKQCCLNSEAFLLSGIIAQISGLLLCGFFVKSINQAKQWLIVSFVFCITVSGMFFFPATNLWLPVIIGLGFISGVFVAAWGFFCQIHTPKKNRMKTAADVLIYSNILMILINVVTIYINLRVGLATGILMLLLGLPFAIVLPTKAKDTEVKVNLNQDNPINIMKPLVFLCLLIVVITINSGLMYQVIIPSYNSLEWLTSWYWALPYITALYVMRNLPQNTKRTYILYIALAMIAFAFMTFMSNNRSIFNYLLVNTLMMGACGIFDLFWWSILGELLDFHDNPAKVFGIGLSANLLGVLLGLHIGKVMTSTEIQSLNPLMLSMAVVIISFLILPPLHKSLSSLMEDHAFLKSFFERPVSVQEETKNQYKKFNGLSERESQVASLLLQRKTYKMIAEELFISDNTVKYYVKNIYSKYHVQSRAELIESILGNKNQ
ncbi:MAG: LuxR family transcriptional regulator [Clostridium sp.]|nr:LuxR family transcriptional regulator [Clostridium sp.]